MIEVFKTDVQEREQANMLIGLIHKNFEEYRANFDLDDCDNILRVKSRSGNVQTGCLVDLLHSLGFSAEVLPDTPVVTTVG